MLLADVLDENMIMLIVWLSIFVVALVVEFATTELVSVWFCIGSALALAVTFIPGMPWWGEMIVFLVASALALLALRPVVFRLLRRNQSKTNIDEIIGKKGIITKKVTLLDNGEVKINGIIWTAVKMEDVNEIDENSIVEVVAVNGNKLIVKKID